MKSFFVASIFVVILLQSSTSVADVNSSSEPVCSTYVSSYKEVLRIVAKARQENESLPRFKGLGELRVFKRRCHFYYIEKTHFRMGIEQVLINENGNIVQWLSGHQANKSSSHCKNVEFKSVDFLSFASKARKKFNDIPEYQQASKIEFNAVPDRVCTYKYKEIVDSEKGQEDQRYSLNFFFDQNGDLFDFYTMSAQKAKDLTRKLREQLKNQ